MSNFIDSLQNLQEMISATSPSAATYFDNAGTYDNNTPLPLFEVEIRSIREQSFGPAEMKIATIQLKYHEESFSTNFSLSAFSIKYELDKMMRTLVKDWHRKIKEDLFIPGIATLTNIQTVLFDDLTDSEVGTKKARRVAIQFELTYKDT